MKLEKMRLGSMVKISTGKLDANASSIDGRYPFFTCAQSTLKINSYSHDCRCVLIAGNGDLNVKYYVGKFDAYQRTYIIESMNQSVLDTKYLFWFYSKYVEKLREKSIGGVIKYIKLNHLTEPFLFVPPLQEQFRLVKILDLAQSLIEKRKQAISYLDDYIRAVFLDMFGDPVSNPKGIKTLKGGELFGFSSGKFNPTKNLSQEYSYPTYGGNGITGFSQKYLIDYPTIVIGRVGAYCGSIHKILSKSWVTDNAIFISKFKLKVNLDFLYYQFIFLNFNRFSDFSGQPKITQKPLESTNYLFPDLVDQNKFSKIVQKTESLKQIMQSQLKELENNFQAQLQRAFRGE